MSQPDPDFRFIPVEMAAQIGRDCRKDQVIVLSFDESCGMLATATWGNTPEDKIAAARAGGALHSLIGGDLTCMLCHADFRHVPAAEAAARIDALLLQLGQARELIQTIRDLLRNKSSQSFTESRQVFFTLSEWVEKAEAWLATDKPPVDQAARYDEHSPQAD